MIQSKAAVFDGAAGQLRFDTFPAPDPSTGELLVRVLGCTLCGSDLHSFEARRKVPVPTILGHEIVGEIISIGAGHSAKDLAGKPLRAGDRVTWAIVANCGECFFCTHGLPQKCERAVKYGHEALRPSRELLGGLADHCLLVGGTSVARLPDDLPLSVACPASCATSTVAAALEAAGDVAGASVCIFGAGMLGLTAAAMARARGAEHVICVDVDADRRARAQDFGATATADPARLADLVADITQKRGCDAVLEMSGSHAAVEASLAAARIGGSIVLVGAVFPTPPVQLFPEQIVRRQLTLRGVHNYAPRHLAEAVSFLAEAHRRWPFAELVTEWLPLTDAVKAFELAIRQKAIRIGVRP